PRRQDIGCAVVASGAVSVRTRIRDMGRTVDITGHKNPYDPIDDVHNIRPRRDLRVLFLTDEQDKAVSANSQREYVEMLDRNGVYVRQFMTEAKDARRHVLSIPGIWTAIDCAKGRSIDDIARRLDKIAESR
ncbi:MAG: hypothetical protein ACRC7C_12420, partial [Beijerinckiaceae bacterium]